MKAFQESKEVVRSVRLHTEEYEILKEEAALARLSISDYIRSRLFPDEEVAKEKDKLLMQLVVRMFGMIEKLAFKTLDKETRELIEKEAKNVLKGFGYE